MDKKEFSMVKGLVCGVAINLSILVDKIHSVSHVEEDKFMRGLKRDVKSAKYLLGIKNNQEWEQG